MARYELFNDHFENAKRFCCGISGTYYNDAELIIYKKG